MKVKSIIGESVEEVEAAFSDALSDGFKPSLAIVFTSIELDWNFISTLLHNHEIEIMGATATGEFLNGTTEKEAAVILLMDMKKDHFHIVLEERSGKSKLKTANNIGDAGKSIFSNPAFIIISGGTVTDGETIIKGIQQKAGQTAAIFGGISGDELRGQKTFLFTNEKSTNDGIIALIIDNDQIKLTGLASHGWNPIGTVRTITDCENSKIYTIDDEPALDLMSKFLGLSLDVNQDDHLIHNVGNLDPIQLIRNDGTTITRAIRYLDTIERSILLAGPVTEGARIRFSLPPDNNIVDTVTKDSELLKIEYEDEAEALIMFSCIGRYFSLGPLISMEIEQVKNVWNAPMAGLFCFGEIGKSNAGNHEFHNNTCCFVALKEK